MPPVRRALPCPLYSGYSARQCQSVQLRSLSVRLNLIKRVCSHFASKSANGWVSMKSLATAFCVLWVTLAGLGPVRSEAIGITLLTQGFAPLQFSQDDEPAGYVTDFLFKTLERVRARRAVRVDAFEFVPWKRAMLMAETTPNILFFSLSRTPEREDKFLWLGEVSPYGQYLYQLNDAPLIDAVDMKSLLDQGHKIGVQSGSSQDSYFQDLGVRDPSSLVHITDYHQGIDMLFLGRIDLLPLTGFLAQGTVCSSGYDGSRLRPVIHIDALAKPLWAVFSKGTDPELVEAFRQEMEILRTEGYWQDRFDHHVDRWQNIACAPAPNDTDDLVLAD